MMAYYTTPDQLIQNMRALFERMQSAGPEATQAVSGSRLIIRLSISSPKAEIVINGRYNPAQVSYSLGTLRPDLDISLPAELLHKILLAEVSLTKALASGQMIVRGPVFKTFALENIFRKGQALYPQVLREQAQDIGSSGPELHDTQ